MKVKFIEGSKIKLWDIAGIEISPTAGRFYSVDFYTVTNKKIYDNLNIPTSQLDLLLQAFKSNGYLTIYIEGSGLCQFGKLSLV